MPGELARQVPALASTSAAYGFLLRNIAVLVRLLLLPIAAIAAVLYFSIRAYLSELVVFIASGDPRAASVALAAITACTLLTLFCASVAASSVVNLALGRPLRGSGLQFRTGRQEWRLYAAYLRFLLVITAFLSADYIFAAQLLPLLIASAAIATAAGIAVGVVGIVALLAAVGFLLPIIVARSQGTVLRKALREGPN